MKEGGESGCKALHKGMDGNSEEQLCRGGALLRASSTSDEVAVKEEAGSGSVEEVDTVRDRSPCVYKYCTKMPVAYKS